MHWWQHSALFQQLIINNHQHDHGRDPFSSPAPTDVAVSSSRFLALTSKQAVAWQQRSLQGSCRWTRSTSSASITREFWSSSATTTWTGKEDRWTYKTSTDSSRTWSTSTGCWNPWRMTSPSSTSSPGPSCIRKTSTSWTTKPTTWWMPSSAAARSWRSTSGFTKAISLMAFTWTDKGMTCCVCVSRAIEFTSERLLKLQALFRANNSPTIVYNTIQ